MEHGANMVMIDFDPNDIEKLIEDTQKHQYFGLNRSIFIQKLAD